MEQKTIKLYARTDSNGYVTTMLNTIHNTQDRPTAEQIMETDVLIGEGYGDDYAHPQTVYTLHDENGCHNYKLVEGIMTERTKKEKDDQLNSRPISYPSSEYFTNEYMVLVSSDVLRRPDGRMLIAFNSYHFPAMRISPKISCIVPNPIEYIHSLDHNIIIHNPASDIIHPIPVGIYNNRMCSLCFSASSAHFPVDRPYAIKIRDNAYEFDARIIR